MKMRVLVADAVASLRQCHKILDGFRRRLTKQSDHDATNSLVINFYVEENLVSDRCFTSLKQQNNYILQTCHNATKQVQQKLWHRP